MYSLISLFRKKKSPTNSSSNVPNFDLTACFFFVFVFSSKACKPRRLRFYLFSNEFNAGSISNFVLQIIDKGFSARIFSSLMFPTLDPFLAIAAAILPILVGPGLGSTSSNNYFDFSKNTHVLLHYHCHQSLFHLNFKFLRSGVDQNRGISKSVWISCIEMFLCFFLVSYFRRTSGLFWLTFMQKPRGELSFGTHFYFDCKFSPLFL